VTAKNSLQGKVAVVTGSAQGIGRATALAFADEGATVVVSDLQSEAALAQTVVEEIKSRGGEATFTACDVTVESDIEALISTTVAKYGHLDMACNNAGYQCPPMLTADTDNESWDKVIAVNLKGVWWCMKHELRQMKKQGGGSIVNIASLAGLVGVPNATAYAASKHGVVGLTKTAALEYAHDGIRVNAVCPALVITTMVRNFVNHDPALLDQIRNMAPLGRAGTVEEIASAVVWLSSPGAGFTTGAALSVDGGAAAS
jgi:NAD(P)-dependent dehydrogenase (short-subunit alcohol dehydrogenase family)